MVSGETETVNHSFEVELREAERAGYEPSLYGTMIQEGRAATGGRRELFAPGSVEWPSEGVAIMTEHRGAVETRAHPIRQGNGSLTLRARATEKIKQAVGAGKKYMSVEFRSLNERTTKGGVREILRCFVDGAALTSDPEYDSTLAEVRTTKPRRIWL